MKTLIKMILLSMVLTASFAVSASYIGGKTTYSVYGNDYISFGVDAPPTNSVCDYHGRQFRFNAKTDKGKNMFAMLMAAELANRKISVWYTNSTAPGTDESSGCTTSTMAVLTAIGFADQ